MHAHSLDCIQLFATHGLQPVSIFCPWDSPGKNIGMSCYFLLQGNLPNSGTEPTSPASPALTGKFFITDPVGKPLKPVAISWGVSVSQFYTEYLDTELQKHTCMGGYILRLHQH